VSRLRQFPPSSPSLTRGKGFIVWQIAITA
jgi:hypothetical protein